MGSPQATLLTRHTQCKTQEREKPDNQEEKALNTRLMYSRLNYDIIMILNDIYYIFTNQSAHSPVQKSTY